MNRAKEIMYELQILIPELSNKDYVISHSYETGKHYLWLMITAGISAQLKLDIGVQNIDLIQFRQAVIDKILNLPILLNDSVLQELSDELFNHKSFSNQTHQTDELKRLIKKKRGTSTLFQVDEQNQLLLFPSSINTKLDPTVRVIQCKVLSLKKYEATIYCIKDYLENKHISPSKKYRLNLKNFLTNESTYQHLSKAIHQTQNLNVKVNAILDAITHVAIEYSLVDIQ